MTGLYITNTDTLYCALGPFGLKMKFVLMILKIRKSASSFAFAHAYTVKEVNMKTSIS